MFYFQVDYLGKKSVDSYEAQDHGCTDEAVDLLWNKAPNSPLAKPVSIKVRHLILLEQEYPTLDAGI